MTSIVTNNNYNNDDSGLSYKTAIPEDQLPNTINQNNNLDDQLNNAMNHLSINERFNNRLKILICTYARMNPPQRGHAKLISMMNNGATHYIKKGYNVDIIIFLYDKVNKKIKHIKNRNNEIQINPTNPEISNPLTVEQREKLLNPYIQQQRQLYNKKDTYIGNGAKRTIQINSDYNTTQQAFESMINKNEYDNILFYIGEDRKEAFGWEGRKKTFEKNGTIIPYLYTYVNDNIKGNITYSPKPKEVSWELNSKRQSLNRRAARKTKKKYISQMPNIQDNMGRIYNIILPGTKKDDTDRIKMAKNKNLTTAYINMIKEAKREARFPPEFPSATMLRNLVISMKFYPYAQMIAENQRPTDANWKMYKNLMFTKLSDQQLVNALFNIQVGMGMNPYREDKNGKTIEYIASFPAIGTPAASVKARTQQKTRKITKKKGKKKKKGGRKRRKKTQKRRRKHT